MPCYHCGARQTDPDRGPSPWRRGVRGGEQVLVCPDCQRVHDWVADLDRCPACGSTALGRVLGETVCKACGHAVTDTGRRPLPDSRPPGLADEVDAALRRVLGGPAEPPRGR